MQDLASKHNIQLKNFDLNWVRKNLYDVPFPFRRQVMHLYIESWAEGMRACNDEIKKMNAGRAAANKWLREYVNRH